MRLYFVKNVLFIKALIIILSLFCVSLASAINEQQFVQKVINILGQNSSVASSNIDVNIKDIELKYSAKNYADWKLGLELKLSYDYVSYDRSNYRFNDGSQGVPASAYTKQRVVGNKSASIVATKRFFNNPSSLRVVIDNKAPITETERYKQYIFDETYDTHSFERNINIIWKYPILKHDSNASALRTYRSNILDLSRKKLSFYEIKEDFLVTRLKEYLQWGEYQYKSNIYKKQLVQLNDLILKSDKEDLIFKKATYQTYNNMTNSINRAQSIQKSLAILLKDNSLLTEEVVFDVDKSINYVHDISIYLEKNNRDLKKIFIDQLLKQKSIDYYNNQNLPKLDFRFEATKTVDDVKSKTTAYDNSSIDYEVSLLLEYPLFGNISNEAQLEIALLGLEKLKISYADKLQDLYAKLTVLTATLKTDKEQLSRYLELINIAEQNSVIDSNDFKHGKIMFKNLVNTIDDETAARIDYIEALVEHQEHIFNYNNLLDRVIIF